jgi:hypothetical protein
MKKLWFKVILLTLGFIGIVMLQLSLKKSKSDAGQTLQLNPSDEPKSAKVIIDQN